MSESVLSIRPRRRNVELGLIVLAFAVSAYALFLVVLRSEQPVPGEFLMLSAVFAGAVLVLHLLIRFTATHADPIIFPVAVALNGLGIVMLYRLDLSNPEVTGWDMFSVKQLTWTIIAIGVAAVVLIVVRDHKPLGRYTYLWMIVSIGLLMLPLVPGLGTEINGARIWIHIGPASVQPGEFAKLTLAIFFASYLTNNRKSLALAGPKVLGLQLPRLRDLAPLLFVWLISVALLVFETDLGTSLLFFGLFLVLIYLATRRISWIIIGLALFTVTFMVASRFFSHVQVRMDAWLHALEPDMYDRSYQIVQGLFGMADGGLMGTGWFRGRPDIIPFSESDFIIPAFGEELGLFGVFSILALYVVFVERGLRTAVTVNDAFGKLLAAGLAFGVALQVFVVIGGVTRVIPLTGLTTPFLAAGGSSLLANWIIVAVIIRISHAARKPAPIPGGGYLPPEMLEKVQSKQSKRRSSLKSATPQQEAAASMEVSSP